MATSREGCRQRLNLEELNTGGRDWISPSQEVSTHTHSRRRSRSSRVTSREDMASQLRSEMERNRELHAEVRAWKSQCVSRTRELEQSEARASQVCVVFRLSFPGGTQLHGTCELTSLTR